MMNRRARTLWICLPALAILAGCPKTPRQTPLMKAAPNVKMNAAELRIRVRGLAPRFAGVIEEAADQIRLESDDPVVQKEALRWKMEAIPTANQAIFQQDPLVALLDTFAFTLQHRHYLEDGLGKERFGEFQPIALEAAQVLENLLESLAREVSTTGDITRVEERLDKWEDDHPIEGPTFSRESIASYVADLMAAKRVGSFAAIGTLSSDVADLSFRIDLMAGQMPKAIRWQSEYLLADYLSRDDAERVLADITRLTDTIEAPSAVIADIPAMVEETKGELEVVVARERAVVLRELERQMGDVFEFLTRERIAVVEELGQEREIVLAAVGMERDVVLEALRAERAAALEDVELVAARLMDQADGRIQRAIDHFFVRLAQLLAVVAVLGAIGVTFAVRAVRRGAART